MAEVEQVEVQSASHLRNMARVNRDEEELRELMKQAGMVQEDNETQEETADSESDSESSEDTSVQAESNTEQKEKTPAKAKAQKEDNTNLNNLTSNNTKQLNISEEQAKLGISSPYEEPRCKL